MNYKYYLRDDGAIYRANDKVVEYYAQRKAKEDILVSDTLNVWRPSVDFIIYEGRIAFESNIFVSDDYRLEDNMKLISRLQALIMLGGEAMKDDR